MRSDGVSKYIDAGEGTTLGRELLDVLFFSIKSIVIPSNMNQSGCLVAKHVQGHPVEMKGTGRRALIEE